MKTVAYLGFQKGGRRDAEVVGCGGGVLGGGCAPSPEKKSFLRPQNNNFGGILTRFFDLLCNNRVQNPFSVSYDLLRVFEHNHLGLLYIELNQKFLVTSILRTIFQLCNTNTGFPLQFVCYAIGPTHCETVYRPKSVVTASA